MVKKLNKFAVIFLFLLSIFSVFSLPINIKNESQMVFANDEDLVVFLGGSVTDSLAEVGTAENPCQTFLQAKELLGTSAGIIYVNGKVEITDEQNWSLLTGQMLMRANDFLGVMFSLSENATLLLSNITIDGNKNVKSSGSVFNLTGTSTLSLNEGAKICENNTTSRGAAILLLSSTAKVVLNGGKISNNTTTQQGGACFLSYGTSFVLNSGAITQNKANVGGAFFVSGGAKLSLLSGSVTQNVATGANALAAAVYSLENLTIGDNPLIFDNVCSETNKEGSGIYISFGKAIYLTQNLNSGTRYDVNVFLTTDENNVPPRSVIVGFAGNLTDVGAFYENFNFLNSAFGYSVGKNEFLGNIMVDRFVSLTFVAQNGTDEQIVENGVQSGVDFKMPNSLFLVPSGFTFCGWSTIKNTLPQYVGSDIYSVWNSQTFYAVYTKQVNYNANGGVGDFSDVRMFDVPYTSALAHDMQREGYQLIGWGATNKTSKDDSDFFTLGQQISDSILNYYNYTLYAVWEQDKYVVSFDAMGGKPVENQNVLFGNFIENQTTTKLGYKFLGWYENVDGVISDIEFDFLNTKMGNKNVNLVAKWEALFKNSQNYELDNVFEIENTVQLKNLAYVVNNGLSGYFDGETLSYANLSYKLVKNVDFADATSLNFVPIGTSSFAFCGVFDGCFYKISRMNVAGNFSYSGMFGVLNNATVKNLVLVQGDVCGINSVGGVAGQATNSNIISCAFGGNVASTNVNSCVGGIVGYALFSCKIEGCVASVNINSTSVAGGIAGKISESSVVASVCVNSIVNGQDKAGGIVGFLDTGSDIASGYYYGKISDATFKGMIAGYCLGDVLNCFYVLNDDVVGAINNENSFDKAMPLYLCQMLSLDEGVCGFGLNNSFANTVLESGEKAFCFKAKNGSFAYLPMLSVFNGILDDVFAVKAFTVSFELIKNNEVQTFYQYVNENGCCFEPFYITNSSLEWFYNDASWNFVLNKVNADITLTAVYENGKDYFNGGNGTEENPFEIANYKNFVMFTNLVNTFTTYNFFANKHYVLTSDIDFENKPINIACDLSHKFVGVFDGNNHTIKNLSIKESCDYVGLFGYNSGVIKNLVFNNFDIAGTNFVGLVAGGNDGQITNIKALNTNTKNVAGKSYVGGICGYNLGQILNCISYATVSATENYAGGITGYNKLHESGVYSCVVVGSVSSQNYAGGIVGYAFDGIVATSFYFGQINARYSGGIVGFVNSASILYCTNVGYIFGEEYVGGIAGYGGFEAVLQGCYSVGDVVGNSKIGSIAGQFAGVVEYCYYEKTQNSTKGINGQDVYLKTTGLPSALMFSVNGEISQYFDTAFSNATFMGQKVWCAVDNIADKWFLPIQTSLLDVLKPLYFSQNHNKVTLYYTKSANSSEQFCFDVVLPYGFLSANIALYFAKFMGIEQNEINLLQWFSDSKCNDAVVSTSENNSALYSKWGIAFLGLGTSDSPYLIENETDLITLSSLINDANTNAVYGTKTYLLKNNITLTNTEFQPIGISEDLPFCGVFLGNAKTISGIYISNTLKSDVGLFGVIKNAEIKNLSIANGEIEGYNSVGGIVGLSLNSNVTNCYSSVNVIANLKTVGSVVGTAQNSTISLCTSNSNYVVTKENAGGIVGVASDNTTITSCIANTYVVTTNVAGGIVGNLQQSNINYCASLSYVSGASKVAGIVGVAYSASKIKNSYFINNITGQSFVAGIVASAINCEIENCYYNAERCPDITAVIGSYNSEIDVCGASTIYMTTEMFNESDVWVLTMPSGNKFFYPTISGLTALGRWYDTLSVVQFEVSNLLIDENLVQYGYVLNGSTYNFKIQINDDRQYDLSTLVVKMVADGVETELLSVNNVYSVTVSSDIKIVASIMPLKRIVLIESNNLGACLESGINYVDDKDGLLLNFVPNTNCYVKSVLVNGVEVEGFTSEKYNLEEIDCNLTISIIFDKMWIEKSFEQQNSSISITGSNVYYDTNITAVVVAEDSYLMQQFYKSTSGKVLCAYDFVSNCSSSEMLKSELTIKVYIGTVYNTEFLQILLLDNDEVKTVKTTVENGYVTLSASKLRAFAIVKPAKNYGWIWLMAFVVVCVIVLVLITALTSKKGAVTKSGKEKVFADKIDLNYVQKRNDYCVSKPIKPKNVTIADGAKKKAGQTTKNTQATLISKEKKEKAFEKLGKINKNKDWKIV